MKFVQLFVLFFTIVQVSFSQGQVKMLDSLFNTLHDRNQFSGNVLVVSGGENIFKKSFGFADRSKQSSLNENSIFNIGAVSQAFTAVAILQLSEKGKLIVDEEVKKYLKDFPYDNITIGHLLTHASGLPELNEILKDEGNLKLITNQFVLELLYKQKPDLQFNPGAGSLYNPLGYVILAEIVEVLSKTSFKEYLEVNVFQPCGMIHTGLFNADQLKNIENVANGYLYSPFTQKYETAVSSADFGNLYALSGTEGDGNIWSTTGDLLSFCTAIASNSILSEESVVQMFLKKTDAVMFPQGRSYGKSFSYGWIIPDAPYRIAEAKGDLPGFNSSIIWNLTENRLVIYLSNDYLSFTSYNNLIPYSVGGIVTQNTLTIPKKWASVELTNVVLHINNDEISSLIRSLKADTVNFDFDIPGINYLTSRLRDMDEIGKADLIDSLSNSNLD